MASKRRRPTRAEIRARFEELAAEWRQRQGNKFLVTLLPGQLAKRDTVVQLVAENYNAMVRHLKKSAEGKRVLHKITWGK